MRFPGLSALPGFPMAIQVPSVDGWISSTSAGAPEGRVPRRRACRTRVELRTSRSPAGMSSGSAGELAVVQPRCPAAPPDDEQPAPAPLGAGGLGDQFRGEMVREVGGAEGTISRQRSWPGPAAA